VYAAADDEGPDPGPGWERLERAAQSAVAALDEWRRRAREAEAEVTRLRQELEELTTLGPLPSAEAGDELRRLRAEHAVLVSRTDEARKRIAGLLARLVMLEQRK
jgi:predicted phage gp36 major capsid-like protein